MCPDRGGTQNPGVSRGLVLFVSYSRTQPEGAVATWGMLLSKWKVGAQEKSVATLSLLKPLLAFGTLSQLPTFLWTKPVIWTDSWTVGWGSIISH